MIEYSVIQSFENFLLNIYYRVLYLKGTELQRFIGDHRSAQNADNYAIKCINYRKPFLVKYKSKLSNETILIDKLK